VINVGVIGCGHVAQAEYLPGLASFADRVKIVALFDVLEERVNSVAAQYSGSKAYTSYDDFLAHSEGGKIDLVFNLTPAPLHRDITARALEAGYSVFSEKPIAASVQEAIELQQIAKDHGLNFFCAPATLVTGRFRWIKEVVASGELGEILHINAVTASMGPAAWRQYIGDPKIFYQPGVGPLIDVGVYLLHCITGILGPVKYVQADGGIVYPKRKILVDHSYGQDLEVTGNDHYSINLAMANGAHAHVYASYATASTKQPWFEIFGTQGAISVSRSQWYNGNGPSDVYKRDESAEGSGEGWTEDVPVPNPLPVDGILVSGILHALDVIDGKEAQILTPEHATHVLEVMLGADASIKSGDAVQISSTF
jgi:predicted dehydrogenase